MRMTCNFTVKAVCHTCPDSDTCSICRNQFQESYGCEEFESYWDQCTQNHKLKLLVAVPDMEKLNEDYMADHPFGSCILPESLRAKVMEQIFKSSVPKEIYNYFKSRGGIEAMGCDDNTNINILAMQIRDLSKRLGEVEKALRSIESKNMVAGPAEVLPGYHRVSDWAKITGQLIPQDYFAQISMEIGKLCTSYCREHGLRVDHRPNPKDENRVNSYYPEDALKYAFASVVIPPQVEGFTGL